MQYSVFPRSGEKLSRLGFGAMRVGGQPEQSVEAMLYCLEQGVNFIDTARSYGHSEEIVGSALKEWRGERPFIATKVKSATKDGWYSSVPVTEAYPPGAITQSAEQSLKALGIEAIDLLQLHQYWAQWDYIDYWMEELVRLKEAGKIRHIGISMPDLRHDVGIAVVRSGQIDAVQTMINIFEPLAFDSLVPVCEHQQVAIFARCVLDEGGLTGFLTEEMTFALQNGSRHYFDYYPRSMYVERVERLKAYIPEHAANLAELAIKFVLAQPAIAGAIMSMQQPEFARMNLAAVDAPPLSAEMFEQLRMSHRWMRSFLERKYVAQ
jgi:aryl-alcohol dehydrogenase-like predicted oxidoreductase